jgi:hypothetical protein
VDVCARGRAAARPSTPAAIKALQLPSCDLLQILQQALASQSTKSKKRRHELKQQKPATATIPVRVEFASGTTAVRPGQGPCCRPGSNQRPLLLELACTAVAFAGLGLS